MSSKSIKKKGTLQSFNVSPKGNYEGLLLQDGNVLFQVNFPQEWSTTIAGLASIGDELQFELEDYEDKRAQSSHPVYQLLSLRNREGQSFPSSDADGSENGHFSGKVERLNYALHGEVNGAILNTGDFLHVKPHGAAALELELGMDLKGKGPAKPMVGGHRVIEAEEVNGIVLDRPKPKKKAHK